MFGRNATEVMLFLLSASFESKESEEVGKGEGLRVGNSEVGKYAT